MTKSISSRKIDRVMDKIIQNPQMTIEDLNDIAATPDGKRSLETLKAMHAISYKVSFSGPIYDLKILDEGILFFYKKRQQMMGFWKGFLTGIISTVTAGIIMNLIMKVITAIF